VVDELAGVVLEVPPVFPNSPPPKGDDDVVPNALPAGFAKEIIERYEQQISFGPNSPPNPPNALVAGVAAVPPVAVLFEAPPNKLGVGVVPVPVVEGCVEPNPAKDEKPPFRGSDIAKARREAKANSKQRVFYT
jgi:hypothetical protein